jgi:Asp/Glu/hydantoin racemase
MVSPKRIALINPNTSSATTALMVGIARQALPEDIEVIGHTMAIGPPVIVDEAALEAAAQLIEEFAPTLYDGGADGIIVAGFGDPGLARLEISSPIPVTGIAKAGMAAAAALGDFSIITTTPDLQASIMRLVERYGHETRLASLRVTLGPASEVMSSAAGIQNALVELALLCESDGARSVLIGGGPLAVAARAVSNAIVIPVIEPVAAAVSDLISSMEDRSDYRGLVRRTNLERGS